jgi:hypothetical protein
VEERFSGMGGAVVRAAPLLVAEITSLFLVLNIGHTVFFSMEITSLFLVLNIGKYDYPTNETWLVWPKQF